MVMAPSVNTAPPTRKLVPKSCNIGACASMSCERIVSLAE